MNARRLAGVAALMGVWGAVLLAVRAEARTDNGPIVEPSSGVFDGAVEVRMMTRGVVTGEIRYTLDGSTPGVDRGLVYRGPFSLTSSAAVRAALVSADGTIGPVADRTYLVPSLDGRLPARDAYHGADVEYAEDVLADADAVRAISDAWLTFPVLAIVGDPEDLFGPKRGLHKFTKRRGREWERPISAEWIERDGTVAFGVGCGMRIHGGWSRQPHVRKHSFRLYFRSSYGPNRLKHPVFGPPPDPAVASLGDEPVTFNRLVLRGGHNDAFHGAHPDLAAFVLDEWVRRSFRDMGGVAPRGVFVHLVINGWSWGLYNVVERIDGDFVADRFGGDEDDYDVVKNNGVGAGDLRNWQELHRGIERTRSDEDVFERLDKLVDLTDLADYMIVNHFAGTKDWDHQNWYAFRPRVEGGRWRFVPWDADTNMRTLGENRTAVRNAGAPTAIHQRLMRSGRYRALLARRTNLHLGPGGALHAARVRDRFDALVNDVRPMIALEAARWGDVSTKRRSRTPDHWAERVRWIREEYLPSRASALSGQYRALGVPFEGAPGAASGGAVVSTP